MASKKEKIAKAGMELAAKGAAQASAKTATGEKKIPRLQNYYTKEVVPRLMKEFKLENPMEVARLQKITINMGLGEAVANPKAIESAVEHLVQIAGQKPVVTKAKKSIATYKLREGMPIGAMVTLRRDRMWEFLDRFVNVALPRVRDFRGVPAKLDGRGNYSLGLKEQIIFPEINYDKVDKVRGMNITFVTNARNDEQAKALLTHLGMPFRK
jgi:large subunit ribosomal protein L5